MNEAHQSEHRMVRIPVEFSGQRIDKVLARLFPEYSRSTLQKWLKQGRVWLDEEIPIQKDRVQGGEYVDLSPGRETSLENAPEDIPIEVVYRDDQILVINKPPGLVVHPGAGNPTGTLLNGLLYLDPELQCLPRAGIVHRLDKDTTGLMVIARTDPSRLALVEQLSKRVMGRRYQAVVRGDMISGCTIDEPIGRDSGDRRRMTVRPDGRSAVTTVRVMKRYGAFTAVRCDLNTGRTHQIRVHLRHIGFPILGDPVYGHHGVPGGISASLRQIVAGTGRQALHAAELELAHPGSGESMHWQIEPPPDMAALLSALEDEVEQAR